MIRHRIKTNVICHIKRMKGGRKHMVISFDAEKLFDKIQLHFMIKMCNKLGIEGNNLNIIKTICENCTANIILSGKDCKLFT